MNHKEGDILILKKVNRVWKTLEGCLKAVCTCSSAYISQRGINVIPNLVNVALKKTSFFF